jgi:hypothetical protein
LNPTLPLGGVGADGDLIKDNVLIDIKVSKNLKIDRLMLNQLICYYAGYLESTDYSDKRVDTLGLYFARHACLWTIKVDDWGGRQRFEEFGMWFRNYIATRDPLKKETPELVD